MEPATADAQIEFPPLDAVLKMLSEFTDGAAVVPEATLEAAGIDSMDVLEWLYMLEDDFGIEVDDELLNADDIQTLSVADIYGRVRAAARSKTIAS